MSEDGVLTGLVADAGALGILPWTGEDRWLLPMAPWLKSAEKTLESKFDTA